MEKLIIGELEIELTKKNIKNLHLSVHPPNGIVKISAPKHMDIESIRLFAISKLSWIRKQQKKFANQDRQPEREYVSGESHYFLGQRYLLNVIYANKRKQGIETRNKKYIDLYVRENTSKNLRERVMTEWYRNELRKLILQLIAKWEPIIGVKVEEFGIKKMKTRWGSCNPEAKRIWLNLELAKKSPACIEYVLVHEMVHILEKSHNEVFITYMDKFLPNWRAIKAELNGLIYE